MTSISKQKSNHKTKEKGALKTHLANKRDMGVIWHKCSHYDYKAKDKGSLKKYLINKRDTINEQ